MPEKEPLEEILKPGKLEGMLKELREGELRGKEYKIKTRGSDFSDKYITLKDYKIQAGQYFAIEEIYKILTGKLPNSREDLLNYYKEVKVDDSGYVTCLAIDFSNLKNPKRPNKSDLIIPDNLVRLKILYISGIRLDKLKIPGTLINLEELCCPLNYMHKLELGDYLISLKKIDCSNNSLSSLKIPGDLITLEEIDARKNKLKKVYIPNRMTNLKKLDFDENELAVLHISDDSVNLVEINARKNKLRKVYIPADAIRLKKIDFGDTTYKEMDYEINKKVIKRNLSKKSQRRLDEFRKRGVHVVY